MITGTHPLATACTRRIPQPVPMGARQKRARRILSSTGTRPLPAPSVTSHPGWPPWYAATSARTPWLYSRHCGFSPPAKKKKRSRSHLAPSAYVCC